MFYGASRGLSAILPSIHSLLVHTVHGQEQLTRFDARLAFKEKVCFDLVELHNYVNETLTTVAREAALALALPTNLVRQEDAVGIRASGTTLQELWPNTSQKPTVRLNVSFRQGCMT